MRAMEPGRARTEVAASAQHGPDGSEQDELCNQHQDDKPELRSRRCGVRVPGPISAPYAASNRNLATAPGEIAAR